MSNPFKTVAMEYLKLSKNRYTLGTKQAMAKNKALSPADSFFLLIESDNTPSQIGVLARMKLPKGKDKSFILDMVEGFRKYQPTEAPFNLASRTFSNKSHVCMGESR